MVTDEESAELVGQALPTLKVARVGLSKADNSKSRERIAKNTWLFDNSTQVASRVQERINWITGHQTSLRLDRWQESKSGHYEHLQVKIMKITFNVW